MLNLGFELSRLIPPKKFNHMSYTQFDLLGGCIRSPGRIEDGGVELDMAFMHGTCRHLPKH
jgi:hypothetical protein